ncbi:MAG: excisionase [Deltaproteobacteria bacterium]|jgi:hypothetical protein|nr:excisionase [Deltaproteobacteria bacterium]
MDFVLMHKNYPVAHIVMDDQVFMIAEVKEVYDPRRLPLGIEIVEGYPERGRLNNWWSERAIPASREFVRELLLQYLRHGSINFLLVKGLGLSLSDQYWIKPFKSDLVWENVNYFDNDFSEDIGNFLFDYTPTDSDEYDLFTPDTTTTGNLRKKWTIIDGVRCLIKSGTKPDYQEPLNEVVAGKIAERLSIDHIDYRLSWFNKRPVSICPCFVSRDTEFVSAARLIAPGKYPFHEFYDRFVANCVAHGLSNVSSFLDKMIVLDFLIVNIDRHFNNFGFLRNVDTLEWIGPAPLFDNGLCLWNTEQATEIKSGYVGPCKSFRRAHGEQISLVKDFNWLNLEALLDIDQDIFNMMSESPLISQEKAKALAWAINWRIDHLTQAIEKQQSVSAKPSRSHLP